MSHELDFTKGVAAIAYQGEVPWHGYGELMEDDQTLQQWLVKAGMDYTVESHPVFWKKPGGAPIGTLGLPTLHPITVDQGIKNRRVLSRSDTQDVLSIVSKDYKVVQPAEVMEFFRDLIDDQGFKMHTAGVLADGNRVWALAETGKDFTLPNSKDTLGAYLLLATSYDGKFSTTAQFTSIRVVCNNTLGFSLDRGENQASGIVRIPHMAQFKAEDVKNELGLLGDGGWSQFKDNVIKLADMTVTKRQAVEFFLELLGVTEEEAAAGNQLIKAKKLIAFYESGPGSDFVTAKNTTWGLVNAVSYLTDHGARAHNAGTRFNSASFGAGAVLKKKAFEKALGIAEAA